MSFKPVEGGCLCGRVRYRIAEAAITADLCHCVQCQKASGAPYIAWIAVRPEHLQFTKGKAAKFESSKGNFRHFCRDCGSPLVMTGGAEPDKVGVTVGSLDEPDRFPPKAEGWVIRRLAWLHPLPGLSQHERDNPEF